jgi:hypothetical protein
MSCYTTFLDNKLLDDWIGASAYSVPATLYIGLSTTTPTQAGTSFTEPSGNGYARVAVTNNLTNWPAAASGAKSNAIQINFPQATGSWGATTYFGIFDATTGGNLLAFAVLAQSQTIVNGDTPYFPAGSLALSLQ